jgi:hypothetical protein
MFSWIRKVPIVKLSSQVLHYSPSIASSTHRTQISHKISRTLDFVELSVSGCERFNPRGGLELSFTATGANGAEILQAPFLPRLSQLSSSTLTVQYVCIHFKSLNSLRMFEQKTLDRE